MVAAPTSERASSAQARVHLAFDADEHEHRDQHRRAHLREQAFIGEALRRPRNSRGTGPNRECADQQHDEREDGHDLRHP